MKDCLILTLKKLEKSKMVNSQIAVLIGLGFSASTLVVGVLILVFKIIV